MVLASISAGFQSFPPLPIIKFGSSGAASQVGGCACSRPLWVSPKNSPVRLGVSPAAAPTPRGAFRGLRLYFPELEPWVAQSALLPHHSSRFIYAQMWGRRVCQPQPGLPCSTIRYLAGSACRCLATCALHPGCPSPPLLPVWMNVSSLYPWLSDFQV